MGSKTSVAVITAKNISTPVPLAKAALGTQEFISADNLFALKWGSAYPITKSAETYLTAFEKTSGAGAQDQVYALLAMHGLDAYSQQPKLRSQFEAKAEAVFGPQWQKERSTVLLIEVRKDNDLREICVSLHVPGGKVRPRPVFTVACKLPTCGALLQRWIADLNCQASSLAGWIVVPLTN